jgi:hypothetical protein
MTTTMIYKKRDIGLFNRNVITNKIIQMFNNLKNLTK